VPAIKLTMERIAALKPRPHRYDTRDTEVSGLLVRTPPSGRKVFNLRYRTSGGSQRTIKLGPVAVGIGQARKLAIARLAEIAAGGDPAAQRRGARVAARRADAQASQRRLGAFLTETYARHVLTEQKRGAETIARLRTAFVGFLDLDLSEITEARVRDWRAARQKAGVAPTTIDREVSMLSTALSHATRVARLITANPLSELRPLVKAAARINTLRFLDDVEERRLRHAKQERDDKLRAGRARTNAWLKARNRPLLPEHPDHYVDHLEPIVLVLLGTGLRFGEVVQLRWSAIDLRTRLLTVHGATAKSGLTRHVPLSDEMVSVLSRWRMHRQVEPASLVFPGHSTGTTGQLVDIKTAWKVLLRRAGITGFRIHDLRHSFASRLVQRGVDLYRVQKLLGHASPVMTQRYAHLAPDHLAAAVAVLDRPALPLSTAPAPAESIANLEQPLPEGRATG
jgi:integrase